MHISVVKKSECRFIDLGSSDLVNSECVVCATLLSIFNTVQWNIVMIIKG